MYTPAAVVIMGFLSYYYFGPICVPVGILMGAFVGYFIEEQI